MFSLTLLNPKSLSHFRGFAPFHPHFPFSIDQSSCEAAANAVIGSCSVKNYVHRETDECGDKKEKKNLINVRSNGMRNVNVIEN
jgi:hypothetical protein